MLDYTLQVVLMVLFLMTLSLLPFQVGMMSRGGVPAASAYTAVVLAASLGTLLLGWRGGLPLAVGPSLAMNTFVIYTLVISNGMSWADAMGCVLLAALLWLLIVRRGWLRGVAEALPVSLQAALRASLGLLLVVTALEQAHLLVPSTVAATALGDLADPVAFLSLLGIAVTAGLWLAGSRFAVIGGVAATAVGACGLKLPDWPVYPLTIPDYPVQVGLLSWSNPLESLGIALLLTLIFCVETDISLQVAAELNGSRDAAKGQSMAAVGAVLAALLGAGAFTVTPQALCGQTAGGKGGRAAVWAAGMLAVFVFGSPLAEVLAQCSYVATPALLLTGFLLLPNLARINWQDGAEGFAAMLVLVFLPLGNIMAGAGGGLLAYCLLKALRDGVRTVPGWLYILSVMFLLQFIFFPL